MNNRKALMANKYLALWRETRDKLLYPFYNTQENRHKLVGRAKNWKFKRDFQINFLLQQGLQPHQEFIDIGCGTLRGGIPIIDYLQPGKYTGIDSREEVIKEGYKELKDVRLEHKHPQLLTTTALDKVSLPRKYDMAWSFSVLIHMSNEELHKCMDFIARHLAKGGTFFANVNTHNHPDGYWRNFPLVHRPVDFYVEVARMHGLQCREVGKLKLFGHHSDVPMQDNQEMLAFRLMS